MKIVKDQEDINEELESKSSDYTFYEEESQNGVLLSEIKYRNFFLAKIGLIGAMYCIAGIVLSLWVELDFYSLKYFHRQLRLD